MISEISRRRIMYGLAGVAGVVASATVFRFARSNSQDAPGSVDRFLEDAGEARLLRPPQFALRQFCDARVDSTSFWYQNFWEFDQQPGGLSEFEMAAAAAHREGTFKEELHRPVVVPAIARLHALASGPDANEVEEHTATVRRIHAAALDPSSPTASREILESIWQSATAALIRNETTWGYAAFDATIVSEARQVIVTYLEEDKYLLIPALSAWQFLLTYEKALRRRNAEPLLTEIRFVIGEILEHRVGNSSFWLRRLKELLGDRDDLEATVPQINEVLMSLGRNDLARHDLLSFFALARLEQAHLRVQVQSGDIMTQYQWPYRTGGRTQSFLFEYGFRADHLNRIRPASFFADPRLGPTRSSLRYWQATLGQTPAEEPLPKKGATAALPQKLARILPFNRVEAHRIVRDAYPDKLSIDDLSDMIAEEVRSNSAPKFISRVAENVAQAFATAFPVLRDIRPERETERVLEIIDQPVIEDLERQVHELKTRDQLTMGVAQLPSMVEDSVQPPAKQESKLANPKQFDRDALKVFASITTEERELHATDLVFVSPHADASKGKLYVFGKTLKEVLLNARERFGSAEPGALMSLASPDGSIPTEWARAMRLV